MACVGIIITNSVSDAGTILFIYSMHALKERSQSLGSFIVIVK